MGRMTAAEAQAGFAKVIDRAERGKERVLLTRRGKAVAAVVPMEDVKFLEKLEDRLDLEDAMDALAKAKEEGTVPWEKIKADLGL